tara:strand:- start:828 stop:1235 length:408 start_codon:yes stop_codon:yes gene_type:complete
MGLGKIFGALGASNPLIAAGASIAIDKLGGASQTPGDIVDPSEYKLSAAKDRAMSMVTKAQQQAEEKPKYKAPTSKKTDMNAFVRDAVLPAYREAPDFKSQIIANMKKQGMPSSVIKEVEYDFSWTDRLEGKRLK